MTQNPLSQSHVFVVLDATVDPAELVRIAPGLQAQLREDLASEWGVGNGDVVRADDEPVAPGEIEIQIHANAPEDEEGALALHDKQPDGTPIIHVFYDLIVQYSVTLSSAVSHELLEARIDPEGDQVATVPDGRTFALEICDQCENVSYSKDGVDVSDFNTRANFSMGEGARYDFCGKQTSALEVLDGGYAQTRNPDGSWSQLGGARMSAYRFELDRRGLSRSARRRRRHRRRELGFDVETNPGE